MKRLLLILGLFLNGFIFGQNKDAEIEGGKLQLKSAILSKLNIDSIDVEESTVVKLTFKIDRKGHVIAMNCESDYPKTEIEFLRAAKQVKQKWKPALKNGKRVESEFTLSFRMIFE